MGNLISFLTSAAFQSDFQQLLTGIGMMLILLNATWLFSPKRKYAKHSRQLHSTAECFHNLFVGTLFVSIAGFIRKLYPLGTAAAIFCIAFLITTCKFIRKYNKTIIEEEKQQRRKRRSSSDLAGRFLP